MTGIHLVQKGTFSGFAALTHTFTTPGAGTETIPNGALHLTITAASGSGAGGASGGGGGGGSEAVSIYAIATSDWGGTISYNVSARGTGVLNDSGGDPTNTTVSGTINAGSISITCGSGIGDKPPGTGGQAFGGPGSGCGVTGGNSSNTDGSDGSGSTGGAGAGTFGPAGGTGTTNPGGNGSNGTVRFAWT